MFWLHSLFRRRSSAFDRHRPLGQTASSKVSYPLEDTTESFNPMARVPDRAQALKGVSHVAALLPAFRSRSHAEVKINAMWKMWQHCCSIHIALRLELITFLCTGKVGLANSALFEDRILPACNTSLDHGWCLVLNVYAVPTFMLFAVDGDIILSQTGRVSGASQLSSSHCCRLCSAWW